MAFILLSVKLLSLVNRILTFRCLKVSATFCYCVGIPTVAMLHIPKKNIKNKSAYCLLPCGMGVVQKIKKGGSDLLIFWITLIDLASITNAHLSLFDIFWLCEHCVHVRKHYLIVWKLRTYEHCVQNVHKEWTLWTNGQVGALWTHWTLLHFQ